MSALRDFLHMGGYGGYVWSAYAIAAVVLIANAALSRRAERILLARLKNNRQPQVDHDAKT